MSEVLPTIKRVNGRRALFQAIDVMLAKEQNIHTIVNALQDILDKSPYAFFKEVVMPITPKECLGFDQDGNQAIIPQIQIVPATILSAKGTTNGPGTKEEKS